MHFPVSHECGAGPAGNAQFVRSWEFFTGHLSVLDLPHPASLILLAPSVPISITSVFANPPCISAIWERRRI